MMPCVQRYLTVQLLW